MNKTTEALKLAEEALVEYRDNQHIKAPRKTLAAIREALAEPMKQEPVAWMVTSEGLDGTPKTYPITGRYKDVRDVCDFGDPVPLYAAPVNPVKQEPVAWWEFNEDIGAWLLAYTFNPKAKTRPLIFGDIAPVDAKAIRAEALEDAVKFLEENGMIAPNGFTAAGIRGLK